MIYLWIVSFIWAFSFGLIKNKLAGLDANFIAAARLGISLIVFLPFLRLHDIAKKQKAQLMLIGALQYGVMYIAYNYAFQYLQSYEVALFTIFTPLYVTLTNDAIHKRLHWLSLAATVLAVVGTAIVRRGGMLQSELWVGFLIMQVSNLTFAVGQIFYKEVMTTIPAVKNIDLRVFGLLYAGGFITAAASAGLFTSWSGFHIESSQIWILLYLGAISSGLAFFLWNVGARRVNAGTLAIFNDLKVPLAVAVSLFVFKEKANLLNLLVGGGLVLAALALNEWWAGRQRRQDVQLAAGEPQGL